MIEKWVNLVKQKQYEPEHLQNILMGDNIVYNLGIYYDKLDEADDIDARFYLKLKSRYGYDADYLCTYK